MKLLGSSRVSFKDTLSLNFLTKNIYTVIYLLVGIFILLPFSHVFARGFFRDGTFTWKYLIDFFSGNKMLIKNTITLGVIVSVVTVILSWCIAYFMVFSRALISKIIGGILFLTMISPPFISSIAYIFLLGKRGFITYRLLGLSFNPYGAHGVVAMQVLSSIPLATLLISLSLKSIDRNCMKAVGDLGGSFSHTIKDVLIPLSIPGVVCASFITFVKSIADFGTPIIIGGRFEVLATEAYLRVISLGDLPTASVMNIFIIIPALIYFILYRRSFQKNTDYDNGYFLEEVRTSGTLSLVIKLIATIILGMFLIKYITIFLSAFVEFRRGEIILTTDYFKNIGSGNWRSILRSFRYSITAGFFTSILGFFLAYKFSRRESFFLKAVDFIASSPYIVPGTFFGLGYVLAFNSYPLKLTGTEMIVVLNCIFRQLPISIRAYFTEISKINENLYRSARDMGAGEFHIIKDILLPNLKGAFMVSFVNTFTTTMTTLGAIIFLISPGARVATLEIFNALRDGDFGMGSAISVIVIMIVLSFNLGLWLIINRKGRK